MIIIITSLSRAVSVTEKTDSQRRCYLTLEIRAERRESSLLNSVHTEGDSAVWKEKQTEENCNN